MKDATPYPPHTAAFQPISREIAFIPQVQNVQQPNMMSMMHDYVRTGKPIYPPIPQFTPPYSTNNTMLMASPAEQQRVQALYDEFNRFSGNKQYIDFDKFCTVVACALCKMDYSSLSKMASEMFTKFDVNQDGYLDFGEFMNGYRFMEQNGKINRGRYTNRSIYSGHQSDPYLSSRSTSERRKTGGHHARREAIIF
ncbi:hypothetical protein ACOME3_008220 [Neoechinorhynchus agilis]